MIGVVSDRVTTSPDSFELIVGMQLEAQQLGKRLLIVESGGNDEDIPALMDELIEHRVDALILAAHFHRPVNHSWLARAAGTRLILLNCYTEDGKYAQVLPNDEQGARDGLSHLYAMGHRRVVVFELFPDMRATQLRRLGYVEAACAAGLPQPVFVQGSRGFQVARQHEEDEFAAVDALVGDVLRQHRPTAIVAGNDKMAARIIQCLHKRQIAVPGQISVLGFDDHPMLVYATDPPLTSVRLPYLQMGKHAAQLACGTEAPTTFQTSCDVRERASVSSPGSE